MHLLVLSDVRLRLPGAEPVSLLFPYTLHAWALAPSPPLAPVGLPANPCFPPVALLPVGRALGGGGRTWSSPVCLRRRLANSILAEKRLGIYCRRLPWDATGRPFGVPVLRTVGRGLPAVEAVSSRWVSRSAFLSLAWSGGESRGTSSSAPTPTCPPSFNLRPNRAVGESGKQNVGDQQTSKPATVPP